MDMQRFIDNASKIPVINGAIQLKTLQFRQNRLIDPTNPLCINSIRAINDHFRPSRPNLSTNEITTYLAASSLLHLLDGWVYLSHAIDSILKGNNGIPIHLAYYAELRASMSFLATEGIGVFDRKHVNIKSDNTVSRNPQIAYQDGTHQFVWNAIEKWANSSTKPVSDMLKAFKVNGITFDHWINAFPYATQIMGSSIVMKWLAKWNFDVGYYKDDRNKRNEVSYRPQRISGVAGAGNLHNIVGNLNSFWDLLEPEQTNKFHLMDKYLLRVLLQEVYSSLSSAVQSRNELTALIRDTLNNLGLSQSDNLVDFLSDATPISHPLFVESINHAVDPLTGQLNPISVIARATLMLRVATGNVSLICTQAGISKDDLHFLWDGFGTESGFWQSGDVPGNFCEMWEDLEEYIDQVKDWISRRGPTTTLFDLYSDSDMPSAINYYKQFHRVGLWGLAI